MVMAYWKGMQWECSNKVISYLESLTTSFAIETDTSTDKEGKSPTEEIAMSSIEVAFSTTYRVETGTRDINEMIDKWKSLVGKASPLVIGNQVFGADNMQLQSVSISNVRVRYDGVLTAVTIGFKFKEYADTESGTTTTTDTSTSALSVGASAASKKAKKTVTIEKNRSKHANMSTV